MRRQAIRLIVQQEQQHELAFRQLLRRQPCRAIAVDGVGQRQQQKAKADVVGRAQPAARRLVQQRMVFRFEHRRRAYSAGHGCPPVLRFNGI
ncbi:hypothetical protein G6F52_014177 [Rhizopus delemar]|nr:hypothetical protein G6F52_014177 [Rhizopus delemar]